MLVGLAHCVLEGVHAAPHWPTVTEPLTQAPDELHVCGTMPMHCVELGVHTPVHEPSEQT